MMTLLCLVDDGFVRSKHQHYAHRRPAIARDRSKGMGLGLAIVKRLALLLNLPVHMQSTVGRGSMFEVLVPIGDPTRVALPRLNAEVSAARARGGLVLVIDDEAAIRDGMRVMLEQWGCTTLCAGSLAELMPKLAACTVVPILILSEYRLRDGESGAVAIEQLQSDYNDEIPAILITGDTAPDRLIEAQQNGYAILHKPVRPVFLRELIDQLTEA